MSLLSAAGPWPCLRRPLPLGSVRQSAVVSARDFGLVLEKLPDLVFIRGNNLHTCEIYM